MCLKSSDQYFNQRGPWFEGVEIIASAPTSEVPLLRVCVRSSFFSTRILDTTFPFKMPVGITLSRPKTAGEAFFDSASNAKRKLWFKVSSA